MFLSHKLSYCVLLLSVFSKFFIYTIEASPLYFAKSEIQNVTETLEAGIPGMYYYPVSVTWQRVMCKLHDYTFADFYNPKYFVEKPKLLGKPKELKRISADGNCWFRAISTVITGSEFDHPALRSDVFEHMISTGFAARMDADNNMYDDGVWATDLEIIGTASFLETDIYIYSKYGYNNTKVIYNWQKFDADFLEKIMCTNLPTRCPLPRLKRPQAIYIDNSSGVHFDIIWSVEDQPKNEKN